MSTSDRRPTLLVSGVALHRGGSAREDELTYRLLHSVASRARRAWKVVVSWGEEDGVQGSLGKLNHSDAVVIMGGPDLSPSLYGGQDVYPNMTAHYPRSDASQIALIKASIGRNIPLLGICRGMQAMNVAQSGSLIQDLAGIEGHSNPDLMADFEFSRHVVNIDTNSALAEMVEAPTQDGVVVSPSALRTMIHSAHHQAVDRVGDDLVVTARADDGTIEALEHVTAPAVGVQWHPEDPDADPALLECMLRRMRSICRQTAAA